MRRRIDVVFDLGIETVIAVLICAMIVQCGMSDVADSIRALKHSQQQESTNAQ